MPDAERLAFLARHFRQFGEQEAVENQSPLYERLSPAVAADPTLLELAAEARPGQPAPNLLFAAVQYVLDEHRGDPLAAAYPAFAGGHEPPADPVPLFAAFCRGHRPEIIGLLQTRLVQTNEVRRSACLFPAFGEVERATGQPLALIEIGPSAGLNLLFDRYAYAYNYGTGWTAGDPASPVLLDSDWRSPTPPPSRMPRILGRVGIDLNALDVRSEADVRWLRALIWPEHDDRRQLLNAAISVARVDPPRLIDGDLFEHLPRELDAIPAGVTPCLFATFVLNQFPPEMSSRFDELLRKRSHHQPLALVTMGSASELTGERDPTAVTSLWLLHYRDGKRTQRRLARCNPHGRWIEWHRSIVARRHTER